MEKRGCGFKSKSFIVTISENVNHCKKIIDIDILKVVEEFQVYCGQRRSKPKNIILIFCMGGGPTASIFYGI